MRIQDLVVVTSNPNKLAEINEILSTNHQVSTIDLPEIQSLDLDQVVTHKARAAYQKIKKPVLVTDVSFEIKALTGLPGPFVKFFLKTLGSEGTVKLIRGRDRSASATDAVAIYDGKTLKIFKGKVWGSVISHNKGTGGFGFDKVFVPKGYGQTFAQMPPSLKNKISHRGLALSKLKHFFGKKLPFKDN